MVDWEAFTELEALVADLKKELRYADDNSPKLNRHGVRTLAYQLRGRLEAIRAAASRLESRLLTEYYTIQGSEE